MTRTSRYQILASRGSLFAWQMDDIVGEVEGDLIEQEISETRCVVCRQIIVAIVVHQR